MTNTLTLDLYNTLKAEIEALPEVQKCYIDRFEEVGQNEPKPVVILMAGNVAHSLEEFHTFQKDNHTLIVEIYVTFSKALPLLAASEPIRSAVDYIIKTEAPKVAGVEIVTPIQTQRFGESGWLGFVRCVYNIQQTVQQLDLTAPP